VTRAVRIAAGKQWLRTLRGQLAVLAAVYAGGLALAVAATCVRGVFFERYVREKHEPPSSGLRAEAEAVAAGRAPPERARAWPDRDVDAVYGALARREIDDPHGRLLAALLRLHGPRLLARLRESLAAGSLAQRERAVELLAALPPGEWNEQAIELSTYAEARAGRRGEQSLRRRAERLTRQLQQGESHE
jgi:hypothetical protein